jgi:hypothetical protein
LWSLEGLEIYKMSKQKLLNIEAVSDEKNIHLYFGNPVKFTYNLLIFFIQLVFSAKTSFDEYATF